MEQRTILLVIDGLGVGELDDVAVKRPQDKGSNTLRSIQSIKDYSGSILERINLFSLDKPLEESVNGFGIMAGKSKLAYPGADSFLGHQEIVGIDCEYKGGTIKDFSNILIKELSKNNQVRVDNDIIIINENIVISNNVECDPGLNLNVLGMLDRVDYSKILHVGNVVRSLTDVPRVIVMGGKPLDLEKIMSSIDNRIHPETGENYRGINIPKTFIYNEHYQVTHLGYDTNKKLDLIDLFIRENIPVSLIGKTANLFHRIETISIPVVNTESVFKLLLNQMEEQRSGLIFVNVQEIDLAGHAEDTNKCAQVLDICNSYLTKILENMTDKDTLIITADHGNDPLIGHSNHTREYVPLILIGKECIPGIITTRDSLSDIASSICKIHNIEQLEYGYVFV